MAKGKGRTRLRSGRSGGHTFHAYSNTEGSINTNIVVFSIANVPSHEEAVNDINSQTPNHDIIADNDTQLQAIVAHMVL